jgi:hypothetical protein
MPSVGAKTAALAEYRLHTVGDVAEVPQLTLHRLLGARAGRTLRGLPLAVCSQDRIGASWFRLPHPVALDLSAPTCPVHAVQVVCPDTRSRTRRSMPR